MQPRPAAFPRGNAAARQGCDRPRIGQAGPFPFDQSGKTERGSVNSKTPDAPSPRWLSSITRPIRPEHTLIRQRDRAPPLPPLKLDLELTRVGWIKQRLNLAAKKSFLEGRLYIRPGDIFYILLEFMRKRETPARLCSLTRPSFEISKL